MDDPQPMTAGDAKALMRWELAGIPAIFLAGSALHFAFQASGKLPAVGLFASVNESVWEHLKLAFWPSVAYAVLEYAAVGKRAAGFAAAKAAGVLLMPLLITLGFYAYTAIVGGHVLWVDILLFLLAVSAGQTVSYLLVKTGPPAPRWDLPGLLTVCALGVAFAAFTYAPPHLPLFLDQTTRSYGVSD